jgi:hypothetical protein
MSLHAGVARTRLTPPWGVELAGWGYYLGRTWDRIRDHTAATALALDDGKETIVLVAVDLMYIDAAFVQGVRRQIQAATGIRPEAICVACSHSHNTPTAGFIRGAGEADPAYVAWAQAQAATAAILAWRQRVPARFAVGQAEIIGWTYNRTRPDGPIDRRLSLWRVDHADARPLAVVVNFQAHPVVMMSLGARDVSRDAPGVITDALEAAFPGLTALYVQGACGDVNFGEEWNNTERCCEPGLQVAARAIEAYAAAHHLSDPPGEVGQSRKAIAAVSVPITLPTRRWTRDEVMRDREEGLYRLRTGDTRGWRENLGRVMVNHPDRFPERYGGDLGRAVQAISRFAVEWTEEMLTVLDTRPEHLTTELQAMRVGDAYLVTGGAELFSSTALEVRQRWPHTDLMIVGYANDSIGYLPDTHDVELQSYAANQSPKFKGLFPFTRESANVMAEGMLSALGAAS